MYSIGQKQAFVGPLDSSALGERVLGDSFATIATACLTCAVARMLTKRRAAFWGLPRRVRTGARPFYPEEATR